MDSCAVCQVINHVYWRMAINVEKIGVCCHCGWRIISVDYCDPEAPAVDLHLLVIDIYLCSSVTGLLHEVNDNCSSCCSYQ